MANGLAEVFNLAGQGSVLASQYLHYRHRGPALHNWCLYEFCALVDIVPKPEGTDFDAEVDAAPRPGRKANGKFEFDAQHPLALTHMMVLRSKHKIPILAGSSPPGHPGPRPISDSVKLMYSMACAC